MRRERENLIESDNMILLDKLYSILSNSTQPKGKKENKSLNYPKRKQEIGRINVENRCLYKSLIDVKPTVDLKKIGKWNESMQRYSRNISSSCRRKDPHRPILTYGILKAYPEMRVKTSIGRSRIRKLSAEVPSFEHFANILNMDLE